MTRERGEDEKPSLGPEKSEMSVRWRGLAGHWLDKSGVQGRGSG